MDRNLQNIRNFSIVAHIDSGKSTLADRFLEITGTIDSKKMRPQFLDMMELEREKGITIKLKPVRMIYKIPNSKLQIPNKSQNQNSNNQNNLGFGALDLGFPNSEYILNLVDTPGHVDFSYEVSRALAAVEGAILLVDATQGIQAQTLANLELARKQNLVIIPVVNKIDSPQAKIEESAKELANLLDIDESEIIKISAKNGLNVEQVLNAVIQKIPPPKEAKPASPFRALIFDSDYDTYKGVIAFVRVVDGEIYSSTKKIRLLASKTSNELKEIGYFNPGLAIQERLSAGEIGYIATGVKEPGKVRVGDTIIIENCKLSRRDGIPPPKGTPAGKIENCRMEPLPGYQEPKSMVFASFYPENPNDFDLLKDALSKLKLSDPALIFEPETKEALGRGFRCGFLGTLHIEILSERLSREFGLNLVISAPSVAYKIIDLKGEESFIYSASDWPSPASIKTIEELWFLVEIITPTSYLGKVMEVLVGTRGNYLETRYLSPERAIIVFEAPLRKIITNLYDKIKSATQGYASMNYKMLGLRPGNLVKLDILIAGHQEESLAKVVPEDEAYKEGKFIVEKLKDTLPPEQFSLALQAAVGGKIIARETIRARRKDVTGYLYGGDYTRKRKLLEKQKKGKKLLKEKGKVSVPQKVFLELFRSG